MNLSARHESFAQAMASGDVSAGEAYRKLYPKSRSWAQDGPRLLKNAEVGARVAGLQAEQAAAAKVDRDALRQWCERVILAKPSEASDDSDICETMMTKAGPLPVLCSKLGAIDRMMRLCGFDKQADQKPETCVVVVKIGGTPATGAN